MATIIHNVTELQAISSDLAGIYELGNDIPCSGTAFTPLGTFTGTLDGKGYQIRNLTITLDGSGYQYGALITTNQGTVQNLRLRDCAISVTSSAYSYAAGVACINNGGTIQNCSVTGTITAVTTTSLYYGYAGGIAAWNQASGVITKSYSTATISITSGRHAMAGGLVALNVGSATISESHATGDVTVSSSRATPSIFAQAAGFVCWNGYNGLGTGAITNCYAKGDATATGVITSDEIYAAGFVVGNSTGSTISTSYSTGAPTGADGIGGFCQSDSGTIASCYWDTTTSGTASSDGGTGKTTAQMKTQATYTGWNFADIWAIASAVNSGYPYLRTATRVYTTPPIYDEKGRTPKGARIEARRNDTGYTVETQTLDSSGKATFTELPNDVGVTFYGTWGGSSSNNKSQLLFSTIIGVSEGGTGASDAPTGRTNLGLGTENSPQFKEVNLGHATDTTIGRTAAGRANIEGVNIVRAPASATDNVIPKYNGTTGDLIQVTGISVDDSNNVSGVAKLTTSSDVELGHTSDTTVHRVSAGKVSVEGKVLVRATACVIAANDSYIKTQADATCDGTDD